MTEETVRERSKAKKEEKEAEGEVVKGWLTLRMEDKEENPEIPPPQELKEPVKGSKNKITVQKLMAEEAARARNFNRVQYVLDLIISQASRGHVQSQRLVWDAIMTKGLPNDQKAQDKVQINIGTYHDEAPKVIDVSEPKVVPAEIIDGEIVKDGEK
jgi:hypothetical protein